MDIHSNNQILFDGSTQINDANCSETNCLTCSMPNPKKCPKLNIWNPRKKFLINSVFITDECNMHCKFCWHRNAGLQYGTITNEMIDNLLNYWYNNFNEYSIVFAVLGGEPTLYPERIGYLAKRQYEMYGTCGLRVYTNGTVNLPEMLEVCHEHENVTFQVSQNYEMIKYGDFYKYCDIASLVVTDDDSVEKVYNKCKKIKELGYKKAFINFDLTDRAVQNPPMAYERQRNILKALIPLLSKDFAIQNFLYTPYHKPQFKEYPLAINFFPDGKFYLTHFSQTQPIGDLNTKLDLEELDRKIYYESPCRTCNNDHICCMYSLPQIIQPDLTQKKNTAVCLNTLINRNISREFLIDRYGDTVYEYKPTESESTAEDKDSGNSL